MRILFLAAEAAPFFKVGGLGDVAGSLPPALLRLGADVRLVLPKHSGAGDLSVPLRRGATFSMFFDGGEETVQVWESTHQGVPVYLLEANPLENPPGVYAPDARLDVRKYAFFSQAGLRLAEVLNWPPDVVHTHDWHTALAAWIVACWRGKPFWQNTCTVLTVHNLPFMGADVRPWLPADLCPPARPLTWLPEWARSLPLPLGLLSADKITTVSPGYAREMLAGGAFSAGLADFLRRRANDLVGILNGIDTESFDPSHDPHIAAPFDVDHLEARVQNKLALQRALGLSPEPDVPLLGMVSRMDVQKGVDLIFRALRWMGNLRWQAVLLGSGNPDLEAGARALQDRFPQRVRAVTRYDAVLARQIYAGADLFLMPSRYEPCGLSQMIAMRYGCLPLVTAVGGLRDTVRDLETGFVFQEAHSAALLRAIRRALRVYEQQPEHWQAMQRNAMRQEFSWEISARRYMDLYQEAKHSQGERP